MLVLTTLGSVDEGLRASRPPETMQVPSKVLQSVAAAPCPATVVYYVMIKFGLIYWSDWKLTQKNIFSFSKKLVIIMPSTANTMKQQGFVVLPSLCWQFSVKKTEDLHAHMTNKFKPQTATIGEIWFIQRIQLALCIWGMLVLV